MPEFQSGLSRRAFTTGAATAAAGVVLPAAGAEAAKSHGVLQVWSCGGLAEAFMPANDRFKDLAKPGIRVILAPEASPPGGQAVTGLLKKAGVADQAVCNAVVKGSCVQRTMKQLIEGQGDVSVVEYRLTRMPMFLGKADVIAIPPQYFPPPPLTFTEQCNDCDKCLKVCEMGTRPTEANCTNCCDCLAVCPQDAIKIGRRTRRS